MARPLRVHFPGAIYHVTGRMLGSWKEEKAVLFRDDVDRKRFLGRLEQGIVDCEVRLYLYCLMSNHFHLLLETPKGNISQFMHSLNTGYTVYFNRRHERHGHLLDGRFKAKLVSQDEYLLKLSRYIHLNPVSTTWWNSRPLADRIRKLRSYAWSSYPSYCGARKAEPFLDQRPVKALTGIYGRPGPKGYRAYVEAGLVENDDELTEVLRDSHLGIGDEDFRVTVQRATLKVAAERERKEDVSFRKVLGRLPVAKVLELVTDAFGVSDEALRAGQKGSFVRPAASRCLIRHAGLSQREVAEHLGVSTGAAISAQVKLLNRAEARDRPLARKLKRLESKIQDEQRKMESGGPKKTR